MAGFFSSLLVLTLLRDVFLVPVVLLVSQAHLRAYESVSASLVLGLGIFAEFVRLGLRVLLNEHSVIEHQGASLVIAGVIDLSSHRFNPSQHSDPHVALAGAPTDASVRILLAHQPRSAPAAASAGFDLQLSGHTTAVNSGLGTCSCDFSSHSPPACTG